MCVLDRKVNLERVVKTLRMFSHRDREWTSSVICEVETSRAHFFREAGDILENQSEQGGGHEI